MADFVAGRTRLLVATTVIEVGVNVPERLDHGDRGRPGLRPRPAPPAARPGRPRRGALDLPAALRPAARRDRPGAARDHARHRGRLRASPRRTCALRGAGDLLGVQQSGLPRFRIADLETQAELMRMAQDDSRLLLAQDPELASPRGQAMRRAALPDGARQGDPNAFRGLAGAAMFPFRSRRSLDSVVNEVRTLTEHNGSRRERGPCSDAARRMLERRSRRRSPREALGLAGALRRDPRRRCSCRSSPDAPCLACGALPRMLPVRRPVDCRRTAT